MLEFDSFNQEKRNSIKVIGVGGGGGNAVNHMFRQGIEDVDFYICNTDRQALVLSPILNKIQIGQRGTGAGSNPEKGKECAIESMDKIKEIFTEDCDMLFITAGMGGGTGTGAAPVIANMAKEAGILTVAIVTLPFAFEGNKRLKQASEGLEELRKSCDGILVINNDKLRELYGNVDFLNAFKYADNVLCTAASGIARFVTSEGVINGDFEDVKSVIKEAGRVIMGTGEASGENRAIEAVESALNSPLLDDNNITGAKDMLLYIVSGKEEVLKMDELTQITDYICDATGCDTNIIQSLAVDENLGDKLSITCIVAGLESDNNPSVKQERKEVDFVPERRVNEVISEVAEIAKIVDSSEKVSPNIVELSVEEIAMDDTKIFVLDEVEMSQNVVEELRPINDDSSAETITFEVRNINDEKKTPTTSSVLMDRTSESVPVNTIEDSMSKPQTTSSTQSVSATMFSRPMSAGNLAFIDPRSKSTQSVSPKSTVGNTERVIQPITCHTPQNIQNPSISSTKEDFRKQLEKMSSINYGHTLSQPAFERRCVTLIDVEPSNAQPRTTFVVDNANSSIKENSFLHKSID